MVRAFRHIMIKGQSISHGFHKPDPVRPMAPDQIEIATSIGAVVGIEYGYSKFAISINAVFLCGNPAETRLAKDAEAPLTDVQLLD